MFGKNAKTLLGIIPKRVFMCFRSANPQKENPVNVQHEKDFLAQRSLRSGAGRSRLWHGVPGVFHGEGGGYGDHFFLPPALAHGHGGGESPVLCSGDPVGCRRQLFSVEMACLRPGQEGRSVHEGLEGRLYHPADPLCHSVLFCGSCCLFSGTL